MKRNLWRRAGLVVLCLALMLCGSVTTAFAAEGTRLTVQLNGEPMEFTDAYPLNRYNRNFLPFRAVFEALGAEVDYYHPTRSAIAVRGDVRVEIPIGKDQIFINRNGELEVLQMDVETFTKNGRTYVPVRFVAQALGCLVEWDQKNLTVVIIDLEKLAEQAMAEQEYTFLESGRTYLEQFESGNWAVEGTMRYEAALNGTPMITSETSFHGLQAEGGRTQLFLSMEADYSALYRAQAAAQGVLPEDLGIDEDDFYPSMNLEMRADATADTSYLFVSEGKGIRKDVPQKVWLTGAEAAEVLGMELSLFEEAGAGLDVQEAIRAAVEKLKLTDSTKAFELAKEQVFETAAQFADRAVSAKKGVDTLSWTAEGITHKLTATYEESGAVETLIWIQETVEDGTSSVTQTVVDNEGTVIVTAAVKTDAQTVTTEQRSTYQPTAEEPLTTLEQAEE